MKLCGLDPNDPGRGAALEFCEYLPCGAPNLMYNGYRVSFPGVNRPGRAVDQPPTSMSRLKKD
jgi:hypothetical protein